MRRCYSHRALPSGREALLSRAGAAQKPEAVPDGVVTEVLGLLHELLVAALTRAVVTTAPALDVAPEALVRVDLAAAGTPHAQRVEGCWPAGQKKGRVRGGQESAGVCFTSPGPGGAASNRALLRCGFETQPLHPSVSSPEPWPLSECSCPSMKTWPALQKAQFLQLHRIQSRESWC